MSIQYLQPTKPQCVNITKVVTFIGAFGGRVANSNTVVSNSDPQLFLHSDPLWFFFRFGYGFSLEDQ
jgi:hypothetical protein